MANVLKTTKGRNQYLQQVADQFGGKIPPESGITKMWGGVSPEQWGTQHRTRRSRYGNKW